MPASQRPVFLHLLKIRLPLTGWVSIVHRITGVLLFLLLPLPLYLLQLSLESEEGFSQVLSWMAAWPLRLLMLLFLWWFVHHLLAGTRCLFIDMDRGVGLVAARRSAAILLTADLVLLLGGLLLL
ncbi:MAG: succinate dehydrogenase, cytochrome b556 subunit [Candidatus Thiodiazotropha sp.]